MKKNNTVRLMHISDVHFGMNDENGHQERNADAVIKAIKPLTGTIDCVIFSGDLAQAATQKEFKQGEEWLNAICNTLDCPCIIVPGNHDIKRAAAEKKELRAARHNEVDFGTWKSTLVKKHPHVKPFFEWFKSCKLSDKRYLNSWGTNPAIDKISIKLNSIDCIFVCLNTALLSCDNDDEGSLCIDIKALNGSLKGLASETNLIVAVGHHPVQHLMPWNANETEKIFGQTTGPHAYLHGHLHDISNTVKYASTGSGYFTGAAGAIYPGSKYKKQFSIVSFEFENNEIASEVYIFNENSGEWVVDNMNSGAVPARLPKIEFSTPPVVSINAESLQPPSAELSPKIYPQSAQLDKGFDIVKNPFLDYAANGISDEAVHLLFVERRNSLHVMGIHHDNIVEGQRGTGKTMLLRFFSIEVQRSLIGHSLAHTELIDELNRRNIPFGIYCCLAGAGLDRTDFAAILDKVRARLLFSHLASLFILTKIFGSIKIMLTKELPQSQFFTERLRKKICRLLRVTPPTQFVSDLEFIDFITDEIKTLRDSTYENLASCVPGVEPTKFNPWLSLTTTVIDTLELLKDEIGLKQPFFILVDDFDKLASVQQSVFFSVAAARRHDLVCFKFGSMSEGIKTNATVDGRRYSEGDDYDHIPLDWVDGGIGSKDNVYKSSLEEITRRRLIRANWPESITFDNLFDNWGKGSEIREIVKSQSMKEFNARRPNKSVQTFNSYWSKQGTALYFRYLAKNSTSHIYAGPTTIVEVSSGIYRQFLEVCGRIVHKAIAADWRPERGKIGPQIQDRCIRDWSTGMYRNLESSGDATNLAHNDVVITSDNLVTLANSLTQYFRWRLMSNSLDPEVIAISIRDPIVPGSFVKNLLDVAVRETLLQRRATDYTNKSGDGQRLPTFQLNRRLVPHIGIGTKIQGRYEIDTLTLELAAKDTEGFLRKMKAAPPSQQTSFDLGG